MSTPRTPLLRICMMGAAISALAACEPGGGFDLDLRSFGNGFDTSEAARLATIDRPQPDDRGVISYPTYQVAVAQRGDTVGSVAGRVGLSPVELANFNAVAPDAVLRRGEVLVLPQRVAEPSPATGSPTTGPIGGTGQIDVTTLANDAIQRADGRGSPAPVRQQPATNGEPVRHRVVRGETAYSIARAYNVTVRALAEWNGLGTDLTVREGQFLLIPVADQSRPPAPRVVEATPPGQGSRTPEPPSARQPLPTATPPAAAAPVAKPEAPDLGSQTTATSRARLSFPVDGKIIRPYQKKKNDGIDIAAPAGTPVRAAEAGTVAAITRDTEQVPILVIRHEGNLLTVYANIDNISVKKGDKVSRGQTIARVRASDPSFVHFEVRQGFDSVDPMPYLQ